MNENGTNDEIAGLRKDIHALELWFVRIDEKLTGLGRIEQRANDAYEKADIAEDIATAAMKATEENGKAIERQENTLKWAVGVLTSILVPLTIFVMTRVFA